LLSVVIPARDEEGCIAATVEHLHLELTLNGVPHEIIVVDDGSTDSTSAILQGLQSHNFAQLRKNLDANEIVAEIVPKALWSKSAELFFHPGESYSGHVNAETSPYPISCIQPSVPDQCWLKLDIEGAEYEVLPALLKAGCRPGTISMEIHDFNHRGNFLLSLLKAYGYSWNELFQPTEPCITINAFKERI
jgi:glycosyltransferase involved in cell wall biosynthesis